MLKSTRIITNTKMTSTFYWHNCCLFRKQNFETTGKQWKQFERNGKQR